MGGCQGHQKWMFHPLQPVPPLLQCHLDHQQRVSHVVVSLHGGELMAGRQIGEACCLCPVPDFRGIQVDHKLRRGSGWVRMGTVKKDALSLRKVVLA